MAKIRRSKYSGVFLPVRPADKLEGLRKQLSRRQREVKKHITLPNFKEPHGKETV